MFELIACIVAGFVGLAAGVTVFFVLATMAVGDE
jgi:hypothetical protein